LIDKLGSYLASKPRRAALIVLCLMIALILALAAILVTALNVQNMLRPAYPSEVTPLSLTDLGITWTMTHKVGCSSGDRMHYGNMSFYWRYHPNEGLSGPVALDEGQEAVSTHPSETVQSLARICGAWDDPIRRHLVIHDVLGHGWFGTGDSTAFACKRNATVVLPPSEDSLYSFALVYVSGWGLEGLGEHSCAVHDGKSYSWKSERPDRPYPW